MSDADDLPLLLGTVVDVARDDDGDGITLTYADGRVVFLIGDGYDGLWQHVLVMPVTAPEVKP
jgi:hypothetical protein